MKIIIMAVQDMENLVGRWTIAFPFGVPASTCMVQDALSSH